MDALEVGVVYPQKADSKDYFAALVGHIPIGSGNIVLRDYRKRCDIVLLCYYSNFERVDYGDVSKTADPYKGMTHCSLPDRLT